MKARALDVRVLHHPAPGDPWLVASPRPDWMARRARRAWHSPRTTPTTGGEARARPTPRQAGPTAGHELPSRAHELSSKGVELLPKAGQPQPPPRAGARRAPCAPRRPRDGPTLSRSEATARRRAPARACLHPLACAAGAVTAPEKARGRWSGGGAPEPQADSRQAGERFPFKRAISCKAPSLAPALSAASPVERRRSSIRNKPARSPAVAPEPDPQERRRDVGRASVLARARTAWRPLLP